MKLSDAPEFLTLEDLQDEIEEYTYRPGWELSVFADPWEGPCLYVKATVENAYQKEPLEIRVRSLIPPIPDAEYFGHWLLWRLIQIENHEAREFLRYGGEPLFDPHDPIEPDPDGGKDTIAESIEGVAEVIERAFGIDLTEWQKSMAEAAQKTLRDLAKGLRGWRPVGDGIFAAPAPSTERRTASNYLVQADAAARDWLAANSPTQRGMEAADDESISDGTPRFEVRDRTTGTGTRVGPAIWDTVTKQWVAPKEVNWGKVYPDASWAERDAARLNNAPLVYVEYSEIPPGVMLVEDVHGHRWMRARKGENRWTRLYPDGSSLGAISPYDDRMLPCILAEETES